MSGITSGIGVFSGINRDQLIEQLMAVEARPKAQIQLRMQQLQIQQAAYLDLNAKLQALKTSSMEFRTKKQFQVTSATSTNDKVMTATSDNGAPSGSYQFIVDRLVSTQQMLSRGFGDRDVSAVGASSFSFENAKARLDRDVSLSDLNAGAGVERGKIVVTDSTGKTATVDLSKAATVNDVLSAINGNGVAKVTASVKDGKFVIKDDAGGTVTVANGTGSNTATSLGIAGSAAGTLEGSSVYTMSGATTLSSLNDGNGVKIKSGIGATSFTINVDGIGVAINLGDVYTLQGTTQVKTEGAVSTVGGALKRINDALSAAMTSNGHGAVTASISADGTRIEIKDGNGASTITVTEGNDTTAANLGILGTTTAGTISGKKIMAGMNSTLAQSLNGGAGIGGDGVLNFTLRDGSTFNLNLTKDASLDAVMRQIEAASGTLVGGKSKLSVSLNSSGTGLALTDNTGGTSNLIVQGTANNDTAASLGISTGASGVASSKVNGTSLQHQWMSRSTLISDMNGGKGIGTGKFRITDGFGSTVLIDIGTDALTLGDVIDEINAVASTLKIKAEINETGDGLLIRENVTPGQEGGAKIKIEDDTGGVAKALRIAGESAEAGTGKKNRVDGSFEIKVKFDAGDTLQKMVDKINAAGAGTSAAIIKDGSGATPYRLTLTSKSAGRDGRLVIDTGGFDLGLSTLDAGENARVFFGGTDPAKAVLLTGSSNTLDNAVSGVKIDLKSASEDPVTLTISRDEEDILGSVKAFIKTFNDLVGRIDSQSRYDIEAKKGGPLVGDSTALQLRQAIFSVVQTANKGVAGRFERLADVGISVGQGGQLQLNEERFRAATAEDSASVEALFAQQTAEDDGEIDLGNGVKVKNPNSGKSFSALGVVPQIEQLAQRYLDSIDGVLTNRRNALDTQIKAQSARITSLDVRLEAKRAKYQAQFLAMEQAIGKLQSQQSALGQLG